MKLKEENYNTRGSTPVREDGFVIGNSSHLIKLMRDSLYSNPIMAICREIASNSRDAHREIGTPERSIRITLPSLVNDDIVFKDWGPGISPVRIDTIYRQLGNSTKRDSNEETGGFGLGAKTPFAYTASFSVDTISRIESLYDVNLLNEANGTNLTLEEVLGNNIKCNYICSLGGDHGPNGSVKCYSAEVTDEETGTEITIGVQPSDQERFKQAVINSTKHWDPRPKFNGDDTNINWPKPLNKIISGDKWSFYNLEITGSYARKAAEQFAIVDGIEYPLRLQALIDNCDDSARKKFLKDLQQTYLCVYIDTGNVSLTPSREELQYNNHTLKFLSSIIDDIETSLVTKVNELVNSCKTYQEAAVKLAKFNKNVIKIDSALYWKGNQLYSAGSRTSLKCVLYGDDYNPNKYYATLPEQIVKIHSYSKNHSRDGWKTRRKLNNTEWAGDEKIIICNNRTVSRAGVDALIDKFDEFHILVPVNGDANWLVNRVKEKLGFNLLEIGAENLSDYIPKQVTKTSVKGTCQAWPFRHKTWGDSCNINRDDEGIYVSLTNHKNIIKTEVNGKELFSPKKLREVINTLGIIGNVYGIRDDFIPKLGPGWKSLQSFISEETERLDKKYPLELRKRLIIANVLVKDFEYFYSFIKDNELVSDDINIFKELFTSLYKDNEEFFLSFKEVGSYGLTYLKESDNLAVEDHELFKLGSKLDKKYPMLKMIRGNMITVDDIKTIQEYIDIMDLVEESNKVELKEAI